MSVPTGNAGGGQWRLSAGSSIAPVVRGLRGAGALGTMALRRHPDPHLNTPQTDKPTPAGCCRPLASARADARVSHRPRQPPQPIPGAVDTAVAGHLDGPQYLGGVALGGLVFSFVFWGFGFLRMGTTGLVARAFGARDDNALRASLLRALLLAHQDRRGRARAADAADHVRTARARRHRRRAANPRRTIATRASGPRRSRSPTTSCWAFCSAASACGSRSSRRSSSTW